MKCKKFLFGVLYCVGASIFAAGPKANMGGSDVQNSSALSMVDSLRSIETALKGQFYNTALREVQELIVGINNNSVAPVVRAPQVQNPQVQTPSVPVVPAPVAPPAVQPPPSSSPAAVLPSVDVLGAVATFPYEAYSDARFAQLKTEINTRLAAPFDVIDDLWKTRPDDCVTQYKDHLDLCVRWVAFYKNLFSAADWKAPLGNYFYDKIINTTSALRNPLKLKSWSAGIHGAKYAGVYDYVAAKLDDLKNGINVRATEIDALKASVIAARDNPSIGKSEGSSWW